MCGRYTADIDDDELEFIIDREESGAAEQYLHAGDVYPSTTMPVLYAGAVGMRAAFASWGYRYDSSSRMVINARSETCASLPMFSSGERVLIPASGYYEWDADKNRYLITGPSVLFLCGLMRYGQKGPEYTIITTSATDEHKAIHHRMPLLVDRRDTDSWLYDSSFAAARLKAEQHVSLAITPQFSSSANEQIPIGTE